MSVLRDKLIKCIIEKIPDSKLNGPVGDKRLPNNVNITFKGCEGEALGGYLENKNIYVSTGSACMSNTNAQSHVLAAIGLSREDQESSIRFTLGKETTEKNIDYVMKVLPEIVEKMRVVRKIK